MMRACVRFDKLCVNRHLARNIHAGCTTMLITLVFVLASAFCAAVLRGFTGFGFAIAAVPLLSLGLPPARVIQFAVLLQLLASLADFRSAARITDWWSLTWLVPGMIIGTPIGLLALTHLSARDARLVIGALILASVLLISRGLRLPPNPSRWMISLVGLVSGLMNGVAAVSGPPVVAFLMALQHSAAVIRATALVFFTFTAAVAIVPLAIAGLVDRETLLYSLLAWPILLVGTRLGAWGFRRAKPHHHRRVALTVLTFLAAMLILRSIGIG
jgi:uncharacterized protein